jgi:hypothetical protein
VRYFRTVFSAQVCAWRLRGLSMRIPKPARLIARLSGTINIFSVLYVINTDLDVHLRVNENKLSKTNLLSLLSTGFRSSPPTSRMAIR